jgi:hypothetical protein
VTLCRPRTLSNQPSSKPAIRAQPSIEVCKSYQGFPPEVGIAELRGCIELAHRLRVNLEVHGVRDGNGISRWYLQWIEATEARKGAGTAVMRELIGAADQHSCVITLKAASRHGADSVERLVAYYQRFGFRRLGGPSRIRVMMTRSPQRQRQPRSTA